GGGRVGGKAVGRAVNAIEPPVGDLNQAVFFLDRTELGRPDAVLALGPEVPANLPGVFLDQKIVGAVDPTFTVVQKVLAELGKGEVGVGADGPGLADAPEDLDAALPVVGAVAG